MSHPALTFDARSAVGGPAKKIAGLAPVVTVGTLLTRAAFARHVFSNGRRHSAPLVKAGRHILNGTRTNPLAVLSGDLPLFFVTQHGAQLFPKFRRITVPVGLDGMLYGNIQYFFFVSRNGNITGHFGWEPAAIDDFATSGH